VSSRARLVLVLIAAVCSLAVASPAGSTQQQRQDVESWVSLELDLIAANRLNPPRAARALALVSRAMYEAAESERAGPKSVAAVSGAAATVLAYLFPSAAAQIEAQAGNRESDAFADGAAIGRGLIARAESDGSSAVWTGTPPIGPGFWVPTPPALTYPPLEPLAGTWQTWNLDFGSQFRPAAPPAYGSPLFLVELQEVYDVSRALTPAQRAIALFWADGAGTVTPPGHWNQIALDLVSDSSWSIRRKARLFAALNTAQADAFIACWDAKFTYWSVRPVTEIQRFDPTWLPVVATPPFPSYVSGHSSTSGAAATVLAGYFPRQASELTAMADEAAISRLYGGIHSRSDNEAGLVLGRRVGAVALEAYGND
jgi:membrane-associated phospholipid phosphatase